MIKNFDTLDPVKKSFPDEWLPFFKLIVSPLTQIYSSHYMSECAEQLRAIRLDPQAFRNICFFEPGHENYPEIK